MNLQIQDKIFDLPIFRKISFDVLVFKPSGEFAEKMLILEKEKEGEEGDEDKDGETGEE